MDKQNARESVVRFSDSVRKILDPLMVVMYGSYAKGSQTPSSDIDVAVIVERMTGDFLDQEASLYRLRREIDDRIEPVLLEFGADSSGFVADIVRTGEIVHQR